MMTSATPAERRRIVEKWRKSPLSGHEFARRCGVSLGTLYNWRRAIERGAGFVEIVSGRPRAALNLASAAVIGTTRDAAADRACALGDPSPAFIPAVEIATPAGLVVRFAASTDEALLRRVLHALGLATRD